MSDFRATAIQLEGEKQWKIVAPHLPANDSLLYSFVASSEAIASGSMISPLHTILGGKMVDYVLGSKVLLSIKLRHVCTVKKKLHKHLLKKRV